ncbi:MAG: O-antigen ligase family protein [Anaerolineae bacterium]|nr:O-antigen ligase family protein [Anaerolineae bacterium]
MNRQWVVFAACVLIVLGSLVGAAVALDQRAYHTRGWEDAAGTLDLPERLPLAGVNVDLRQVTPGDLPAELDRIAALGFTWVRQSFLWQDIEPEQGEYTWDVYDAIVAAVGERDDLQLVAVLDGTPPWARHTLAPEHPYAPPASVSEYGHFAGMVAARYADTITQYQVWDEPNIKSHWGNMDPRPAHYVAMLREAYTAIHVADGSASVIAAALAPNVETGPDNLSDLLFLRAIYDQGGGDYFDAAAGKPYGYDFEPGDRRVDESILNFSRLILLREEMVRRGDADKPLWGSNFGWNYLPADWSGPPSIWGGVDSLDTQQRYTREAYARAAQEWPWVGGLIVQHWQPDAPPDDPLQGFAIAPHADAWLDGGPLVSPAGLVSGRHPVQNPYTDYSDNWRFSDLGADALIPDEDAVTGDMENRITVQFEGTAFAIPVRRDDYIAYLYVTVDGEPANALPRNRQGEAAILLTSPEREPDMSLIRVADGLPDGLHTAEIIHRPINGDDRWPIAGYAVGSPPDTGRYDRALIACGVIGGLALLGAVTLALRLPWQRVQLPSLETVRRFEEWLLGLFVSGLVLLGTLLTWGEAIPNVLRRDPPALALTILTAGVASLSPVFVITLAALAVLFVLIYNRPLLGVMLVIFWSAFYLSTLDLLIRLFATVEVYLVMTVAAVILRALVDWARARREAPNHPARCVQVTALDGAALVFAALGLLSLAWVEFWGPATHELRVVILEPVLFYMLLRWMRLDGRDLMWLADTLLFTGAAIAVVGLYLFVTGESVVEAEGGTRRLLGVYGSPNGVGLYLGRCLPFALAYTVLPVGYWRRWFGVGTGAVMLLAVLLSQSRGAILLGLPAALIVMLLVWRGRRALVPVIGAALALVVAYGLLSLALPRLADLSGDTAFFREHLWYSSINLIREKPLTGAGLDQFLYLYRSRYLLPEAWAEPDLSIPHNILLNHWVNLGVLGVLAGVALQALYWRALRQVHGRVSNGDPLFLALVLGLAGSMADLLGHGLVDVGYFAINLAFVFFLSLALVQRLALATRSPGPGPAADAPVEERAL